MFGRQHTHFSFEAQLTEVYLHDYTGWIKGGQRRLAASKLRPKFRIAVCQKKIKIKLKMLIDK